MRREQLQLDVPLAGNGNGSAASVRELEQLWVQVGGTFTATVAVHASLDGTNYVQVGSTTTPALIEVAAPASSVRIVVSGWSAGHATATLAGRNSRTE